MKDLRPETLDEIIGQDSVKQQLEISIKASQIKNEPLPHVFFFSPQGLGKSTFALAIANELNVPILIANGASLTKFKQLLIYLSKIKEKTIFFIDEIHRLSSSLSEILYLVLEQYQCHLTDDANPIVMNIPKFTFLGATTNPGDISSPLYDRFKLKYSLEYYSDEEIMKILQQSCSFLNVTHDDAALEKIAQASKGTARIANNHLRWVTDYALVNKLNHINKELVSSSFSLSGINDNGLDENDEKYLKCLSRFRPKGIKTIVGETGLSEDFVVNVVEPYLLRKKIIVRTPRGRIRIKDF